MDYRPYRTNKQQATSFRGLGYSYFEKGSFGTAAFFLNESLSFEFNQNAIQHIELIAKFNNRR